MDNNKDLIKIEDGKQKINMLPIIENITKLVGAIVIVIMFLMFIEVFWKGTWFHALFTTKGYSKAGAHFFTSGGATWLRNLGDYKGLGLFNGSKLGILGSGDVWIAISIWTFIFLAFITAMVSYIVYYVKDLIVLVNEIVRTIDRIRNSVTESVKESALFNDDILGKSKREEKERKKIEEEEKKKFEKEMREEIRKNLEAEYAKREAAKPEKVKEVQTYQENLIEEDPEVEDLPEEFQEVLRNTREKNKTVEQSQSTNDSVTDLSDEEIDELLKG